MNNDKKKFIYFGFRQMLPLCNVEELDYKALKLVGLR